MDITRLKYFYFVAREGGVSKAARALKIAQPAVTRMVKSLENELGTRLFERDGVKMNLTQAGTALMRHCAVIFAEIDKAQLLFPSANAAEVSGRLLVGTGDALAVHLFPKLLSETAARYAGVHPWIVTGTGDGLCRRLSEGGIDLAWLFTLPPLPEGVEVLHQFPIVHRVVASTEQINSSATRTFFIGSREVDDVGAKRYPTVERIRRDWPEVSIKISSNSVLLHRELALAGVGTAVIPEFVIADDLASGRLTDLYPNENFVWPLNFVARAGEDLSSVASTHLDLAKKILRGWGPEVG